MKREYEKKFRKRMVLKSVALAGGCATLALATVLMLVPTLTPLLGQPAVSAESHAILAVISVVAPSALGIGKALLAAEADRDNARRLVHGPAHVRRARHEKAA